MQKTAHLRMESMVGWKQAKPGGVLHGVVQTFQMSLSSFLFRPSPAAAGPQTAISPTSIPQPPLTTFTRPFAFLVHRTASLALLFVLRLSPPTLPSKQNHYLKSPAVIRLLESYLNFSQILSNTPFCVQVKQLSLSLRENRRKGKVWNLKAGKL